MFACLLIGWLVCVRARVCVCARALGCVCARARLCVWVCAFKYVQSTKWALKGEIGHAMEVPEQVTNRRKMLTEL